MLKRQFVILEAREHAALLNHLLRWRALAFLVLRVSLVRLTLLSGCLELYLALLGHSHESLERFGYRHLLQFRLLLYLLVSPECKTAYFLIDETLGLRDDRLVELLVLALCRSLLNYMWLLAADLRCKHIGVILNRFAVADGAADHRALQVLVFLDFDLRGFVRLLVHHGLALEIEGLALAERRWSIFQLGSVRICFFLVVDCVLEVHYNN